MTIQSTTGSIPAALQVGSENAPPLPHSDREQRLAGQLVPEPLLQPTALPLGPSPCDTFTGQGQGLFLSLGVPRDFVFNTAPATLEVYPVAA
jgi:hypothetical protein